VTKRTKVLAAIGLVAALGAGVAGGLASSASARSRPTPVRFQTAGAPVTSVSFSFSVSVSGLTKHGGAITVTGSGQADFANDAASLQVNLPAGVAGMIPGAPAGPEVVNVVLSAGTVYAEVPALSGLVGAPWVSVALPSSVTSGIPGVFSTIASALGNANDILTFASAHHGRSGSLGASTVDGSAATGSRVAARLPGGSRLSAAVWVDGSGHLVRVTGGVTHGGGPHGAGITGSVDLTGYGAPVTVTVPPSSQVKAIPYSLVAQFLGSVLKGAHLPLRLPLAA